MNNRRFTIGVVAALLALSCFVQGEATTSSRQSTVKDSVTKPVFSLDMSASSIGKDVNGKPVPPKNDATRIIGGLRTEEDRRPLIYDISGLLNNDQGTVMFWTQGAPISLLDGKEAKLFIGQYGRFYAYRMSMNGKDKLFEERRWFPYDLGSWTHLTLCWEKGKVNRFFVNGLPYEAGLSINRGMLLNSTDIASAKDLCLDVRRDKEGNVNKIDRMRLYNRALKTSDVYSDYRKEMPIDLIVENAVVYADRPDSITLNAAPAGYYVDPNPVPGFQSGPKKILLKSELFNDKKELLVTDEKSYMIDKPIDIKLPEKQLPVGNYKLKCTVNNGYFRIFTISSVMPEKVTSEASDAPWKRAKLLYERKFDSIDKMELKNNPTKLVKAPFGSYLECSPNCWDRMSTEISFPKEQLGKPCLIDITWPDDKARSMGLYMYPHKGWNGRDRLAGGIHSGDEFPLTNKMKTTSFLFFPNCQEYLFEARSFGIGTPAAVAEIKVWALDENFPRLKIDRPANLPARQFGFYDEDQAYMWYLNDEAYQSEKVNAKYPNRNTFALKETMRYFDYSGITGHLFGTLRYQGGFNVVESRVTSYLFPFGIGNLTYIMDSYAAHDKAFVGYLNLIGTDPALAISKYMDSFDDNVFMVDRWGKKTDFGDPSNQKYRELFFSHLLDVIRKYASNPSFSSIYSSYFRNWGSLKYGYGDSTMAKFTKDTGIKVPKTSEERYAFLTGEKRGEWLAWRKKQMKELVEELRAMIDQYNPKLKLYIGMPFEQKEIDEIGLDYRQIGEIHDTCPVMHSAPYIGRRDTALGGEPHDADDKIFDFSASLKENQDLSLPMHALWEIYYETNLKALMPEKYNARFQAPSLKPVGRGYLKILTFSVAAHDSLNIYIGGQTLSTTGVEDIAREFAQAYCALPALPFKTVPGTNDPVVARSLDTKNGTYFYVVNFAPVGLKAKLELPNVKYRDLSTGKTLSGNEIELKSYQLRSFLIPNEKVEIKSASAIIPESAVAFYKKRFFELENIMTKLEKNGISCEAESKLVKQSRQYYKAGRLAEALRLSYSFPIKRMTDKVPFLDKFTEQQKMIDQGSYRINCGSFNFSEHDNKLFFPDQMYRGFNNYGYVIREDNPIDKGWARTRMLNIDGLHGTKYPDLFRTKNCALDGYRMKVPNGTYLVKLYMREGYKKAFRKDALRFKINAQGKPWADIDLYEMCKHDADLAAVFEKEVKVENGMIELDFLILQDTPDGKPRNGTERMLNGIEVIPIKENT